MPKATVDINHYERKDLKSCPGGYVTLRKLTFDEYLERRDMMTGMVLKGEQGSPQDRKRKGQEDFEATMKIANRKGALFEFARCIGEHNLYVDEAETQLIDFRSPMALKHLDPKVGEEISQLIDEMNEFDLGEEEHGPFPSESNGQSSSQQSLTHT